MSGFEPKNILKLFLSVKGRVHVGFRRLWNLIMPFSRTWNVLENREFFLFGFLFGKILKHLKTDLSWFRINTVYLMLVYFTTYNIIDNLPRNDENVALNIIFSIFIGFWNGNKSVFHGFWNFVIWLWKSFGNIFRVVCTNFENENENERSTFKTWLMSYFIIKQARRIHVFL